MKETKAKYKYATSGNLEARNLKVLQVWKKLKIKDLDDNSTSWTICEI